MSETIYAVDNGQRYSSHQIRFVMADPEEFENLEEFLDWKSKSDCFDDEERAEAGVLFSFPSRTEDGSCIRRADQTCALDDYIEPEDFMIMRGHGKVDPKLDALVMLGRKRAEFLMSRWSTVRKRDNWRDELRCAHHLDDFRLFFDAGLCG